MKPCPVCGAMLTASLAEAVANPNRDESCPMGDAMGLHIAALFKSAYERLFAFTGGSFE